MSASDDEEYTIPLQDKRVFGAGIKRKRVQFVASSDGALSSTAQKESSGPSASDFYLSLVLPRNSTDESKPTLSLDDSKKAIGENATAANTSQPRIICEVCRLPIDTNPSQTPHSALLAHQLSLPHSHPPSSLSRSHPGLRILQSQGWDPDSLSGLGAREDGIRYPIKATRKADKMGIGASIPVPKRGDAEVSRAVKEAKERKEREEKRGKKGKGWLKKMAEEEKRKGDKLKDLFYASESVDRYLGRSGSRGER